MADRGGSLDRVSLIIGEPWFKVSNNNNQVIHSTYIKHFFHVFTMGHAIFTLQHNAVKALKQELDSNSRLPMKGTVYNTISSIVTGRRTNRSKERRTLWLKFVSIIKFWQLFEAL